MRNMFLEPLDSIIASSETLLLATELEDLTRRLIEGIHTSANQLRDLIISLPDLTWDNAKIVLSYETRTHMATMMGYAESLLDGDHGDLPSYYTARIQEIHAHCKQLLARLAHTWD